MREKKIKLIRKCAWEEVFLNWYKNEGEDSHWQDLARERGFASWADWRLNGYARRFKCEQADWGFYEIENAPEIVSHWFGGPFRTWIEKYYAGAKTKSFAELAELSSITNLDKVKSMMKDYPKESVITALELANGKIFVIEGMHRVCALALMHKQGKVFSHKLTFALGKSELAELPSIGQNTSKD